MILDKSDKYKVENSDNAHKLYNPVGDSLTDVVTYLTKTKPEIEL